MNQLPKTIFVGRKDCLATLQRRLRDLKDGYRQNVAIMGNRFVGKTVLLQKFLSDLDDDGVVEVYVDLEGKDQTYLFDRFICSLLYNFSRRKGLPVYEEVALLLQGTQKVLPKTVAEIKCVLDLVQKAKWDEALGKLLSLPEIFSFESGKICLIVLEEFQVLGELCGEEVFAQLGKRVMTQKNCLYVLSSSYPTLAKRILAEKLSLLFGNFEILSIGSFDLRSSQEYIEQSLVGLKMRSDIRHFLMDFTGGCPAYLQMLCLEIRSLSAIHQQSEVFWPLLSQAVENVLFAPWGVLSKHFELKIEHLSASKSMRESGRLLLAVARGVNKAADLAQAVTAKSALTTLLSKLTEEGVLIKNGQLFHLEDKLLRYWLRYVLDRRWRALDLTEERLVAEFREDLKQAYQSFLLVSQENLVSRVVSLLECFDNDAVSLNGRKYKLSLFREIETIKFAAESRFCVEGIRAISEEGEWFIVLKEKPFDEQELNVFLNETKKSGKKPFRRVVISLSEMDPNTRLKALEERLWIWNESEINSLLNYFNKPFIVSS